MNNIGAWAKGLGIVTAGLLTISGTSTIAAINQDSILINKSIEPILNQENHAKKQQVTKLPRTQTIAGLCWSEPLQKMVPC
jgi:hypothetical protein